MIVLVAFLLLPFVAILKGLCLRLLWAWFVCPLGVGPISISHAIGIALVMMHCTHQRSKDPESTEDWIDAIVHLFVSPVFTLLIGYIVHSLMRGGL